MKAQVCLTVAESKRLIARGVVKLEHVCRKMEHGTIVVARGSTNAYILEEMLGKCFDKRTFVSGWIEPATRPAPRPEMRRPDAVFVNGHLVPDLGILEAVKSMQSGDIFIKGANALNYDRGLAGIMIAADGAGTIGMVLGHIISRKLALLLPVGLEKCVPYSIEFASAAIAKEDSHNGVLLSLFPVHGQIFTEIEALRVLTGVEAIPYGAGGIGGAEGSISLLIRGCEDSVNGALRLVEEIQGEPEFMTTKTDATR